MAYTFDSSKNIWRVTFSGTLTGGDLNGVLKQLAELDRTRPTVPNRFVDLTQVEGVAIGYPDMDHFTRGRREYTLANKVKTALVTSNSIQYGFARMFQTLLNHPQVSVRLFDDEKDALDWLSRGSE